MSDKYPSRVLTDSGEYMHVSYPQHVHDTYRKQIDDAHKSLLAHLTIYPVSTMEELDEVIDYLVTNEYTAVLHSDLKRNYYEYVKEYARIQRRITFVKWSIAGIIIGVIASFII